MLALSASEEEPQMPQIREFDDQVIDWAEVIETAMETQPLETGWTPSSVARKAKIPTNHARFALQWLVKNNYIVIDDRGAWSRYYLKADRYSWTDGNGLPTNVPPSQR
jgi:hypothetical protein